MPRTKRVVDEEIKQEMNRLAIEFKRFRENNTLSQKFLAEIIKVSRRTIQMIESGAILPQEGTLKKFEDLRSKYESEGKKTGKRKPKKTEEEEEF
jgi:DNA-binding XRE family transcriptional regulator